MTSLTEVAPAFVAMAHRIVWATVATVDGTGRPWTRILHPIWRWDADTGRLTGWIATGPTPTKVAHLAAHPYASLTYWEPSQDTASAYCDAQLVTDLPTREWLWGAFTSSTEPVGYDPAIIPQWRDGPGSPGFAALRLDPWRVRVQPADVLLQGRGELVREWRA